MDSLMIMWNTEQACLPMTSSLTRSSRTTNTKLSSTCGRICKCHGAIESFWAMMKQVHKRAYNRMSVKHLYCYVLEFEGRHNVRGKDTIDQMKNIVKNMDGKRLKYAELVFGIDRRLNLRSKK